MSAKDRLHAIARGWLIALFVHFPPSQAAHLMLPPLLFWLLLCGVAAYAFGRGRMDERLAAGICLVGSVTTFLVSTIGRYTAEYSNIEVGILLIDSLVLLGFVLLALHSKRFWPLWLAGFQLTSTFAHAMKAVQLDLLPQVYAVAERFWVYPIFLVIVIGTWRGRHRWLQETQGGVQPA